MASFTGRVPNQHTSRKNLTFLWCQPWHGLQSIVATFTQLHRAHFLLYIKRVYELPAHRNKVLDSSNSLRSDWLGAASLLRQNDNGNIACDALPVYIQWSNSCLTAASFESNLHSIEWTRRGATFVIKLMSKDDHEQCRQSRPPDGCRWKCFSWLKTGKWVSHSTKPYSNNPLSLSFRHQYRCHYLKNILTKHVSAFLL